MRDLNWLIKRKNWFFIAYFVRPIEGDKKELCFYGITINYDFWIESQRNEEWDSENLLGCNDNNMPVWHKCEIPFDYDRNSDDIPTHDEENRLLKLCNDPQLKKVVNRIHDLEDKHKRGFSNKYYKDQIKFSRDVSNAFLQCYDEREIPLPNIESEKISLADEAKTDKNKTRSIALYKDYKNAKWEKIIIILPGKDESSSYEFNVKNKGLRKTHSFSLKEFGFWNKRENKPNRLFIILKTIPVLKRHTEKIRNKNELRKYSKSISDLRRLLKRQLGINSDPFYKDGSFWRSKFDLRIEKISKYVEADSRTNTYKDWMDKDINK